MAENRQHERAPLRLQLNYRDATGGNFLYEYSRNISDGGIFIETDKPLPEGVRLTVRFQPPGSEDTLEVEGEVAWVNPMRDGDANPNPGMGVRFVEMDDELRATIESIVKAVLIL